jgi:hypothetical protein
MNKIILLILFFTVSCFAETKIDFVGDNETAFISGKVVDSRDNETGRAGVEILACQLFCSECVFEGLAITNSEGEFHFPNLKIKSYRIKAVRWEADYSSVTPDEWIIIFREAK